MRTSPRTGLWVLGAALLASAEFGYAHLQQLAFWPVQLIASSLWRLAGAQTGAADSVASWAAPVGLILAGLVAELVVIWTRRRTPIGEGAQGDDHE
jgi:hypothetical protein